MLRLTALRAFEDNYIWMLADSGGRALIVDPGQAAPVLAACAEGIEPVAYLLTHHHHDHIGGMQTLLERHPAPCYAPADARIELNCQPVADGDRVEVQALGIGFDVIGLPGHTLSHIGFTGSDNLFCGDTLFSLGCGRLFEGTPAQMSDSLKRLAVLPGKLQVCCAHEYTEANGRFALRVEPENAALRGRLQQVRELRAADRPSLPVDLDSERACNPFLRTDQPAVRAAAERQAGRKLGDEVEVFAALRRWKDDFRA